MSGFMSSNNSHLIWTDVWTKDLQHVLKDDLNAMRWVNNITDFTHGTTLHMPIIGEAEVADFAEGQAARYNRMDTGEFLFTIDKYQYSGNAISEKFKRDSFYAQEVISSFVPEQHRALMVAIETRIFERANSGQTASDYNLINEARHRWVGSGTSESMTIEDFAWASYALQQANIPMRDLVAVVDPTVAHSLATQPNVMNQLSPQPEWANVVHSGMVTGMRFRFNIWGFDVYVSNYLPKSISETIDGRSVTTGVANQFFSAAPGITRPIVFAWRQQPTVQSKFEQDLQETQCLTICEYGAKLRREDNMVIVLTDRDTVY